MTVGYFDSSALVKLVIEEPGSDDAAALWDVADVLVSSRVAHPEVRAALAAAHRAGRLDDRGHRRAKRLWNATEQHCDWWSSPRSSNAVPVTSPRRAH